MAKKRKAPRPAQPKGPREVDAKDASLRINSYEDVADSEDEYFMNQDRIDFDDEPRSKRIRRQERGRGFPRRLWTKRSLPRTSRTMRGRKEANLARCPPSLGAGVRRRKTMTEREEKTKASGNLEEGVLQCRPDPDRG